VALPSRSNLAAADVAAFRAAFGLGAGKLEIAPNGADPGKTGDEAATVLAASWASVAAPGARILVVPAQTTAATDGADLALAAIVDGNLAHMVAVNYSACEVALGEPRRAFYAALYRQAAAQGMAVVAAAGDSGAAACQAAGSSARVSSGYAVNALASTPWNTAVGAAALSGAGLAAWSPLATADPAYAGGGGRSAIYSIPSWQSTTATGASWRSLPDLTLPVGLDSGLSHGLAFCLGSTSGQCKLMRAGGTGGATALVAGLGAVLASRYGAPGNLAPTLYAVERARAASFEDIATGTNRLACAAGSSGCTASGRIGYAAATGYDLATGLGSVNAGALVENWRVRPEAGTGKSMVNFALSPTEPNNTYNPSTKIALTATVVSGTGGATPTGTVSFLDASSTPSATLGSAQLNASGVGSISIQNLLSNGGHNLQAQYNGNTTYAVSTSPANEGQINIQPSSTAVTVVPSTTSPTAGQTITVTTTVSVINTPPAGDTPPSGYVTLNLAGGPVAYAFTADLTTAGGVTSASFTITIPSGSASFSLQAVYAGDANYKTSTSSPVTLNLAKSSTTSAVAIASSSVTAGAQVTVTATVTPSAVSASYPSGSLAVKLDSATVGSITLTPGSPSTGSTTITIPSGGQHTLGGSYGGDSYYTGSTAPNVAFTAAPDPTRLTLTTNTSSYAPGTSVTVTAHLTATNAQSTAATGKVTFTYDGTVLGSVALSSAATAAYTVSNLAAGTHTVTASYVGDANYATATNSLTLDVQKLATTTVIAPATSSPTYLSSLAVTLTVAPTGAAASTKPSGTVTLYLDGNSISSGQLTAGSPSATKVTIPAASLTVGTHVLTATYNGDTYYSTSTATAISVTVAKLPTTSAVTYSPTSPSIGQTVTLTASVVAGTYASANPTGTINFKVDNVTVASKTLTAGQPSTATAALSSLTGGAHTVTVTYQGDTNYAASSSSSTVLTVSKGATVTTLAVTPTTLAAGVTETLTATVAPADSSVTSYTIGGTVYFYDGGALLGSAALASNTAKLSNVSLNYKTNHTLTAVYAGNTSWMTSTSDALELDSSLLPVTVLLTANVSAATPGQAVVLTATVTPSSTVAAAEANPTGTVIFYNGAKVLGSAVLAAVAGTNSSTAMLTLSTLPGGVDSITAVYQGDNFYAAATSNPLPLAIQDFTLTQVTPSTILTIVKGSSGSANFVVTGQGGFDNLLQVVCSPLSQDDMRCTASPQRILPGAPGAASCPNPGAGGCVQFNVQTYLSGGPSSLPTGTPLGLTTIKITASAFVNNTVYSKSVYLSVNVVKKAN
jgi:VCBS repeat-containing protein